jgi:hypothetical protein
MTSYRTVLPCPPKEKPRERRHVGRYQKVGKFLFCNTVNGFGTDDDDDQTYALKRNLNS